MSGPAAPAPPCAAPPCASAPCASAPRAASSGRPAPRGDGPGLVLHLGDHKTGSTSIQHALASGRIAVPGVRLCYPMGTPPRSHHNHVVRGLIREARGAGSDAGLAELAAEIAAERDAGRADLTILSAEAFERADPGLVAAALARHLPWLAGRERLIVYLRPHAERLVSTYAEQVKQGLFRGDLERFFQQSLKRDRFAYAPRLRRWRAVFGDRLTVRPMLRPMLKDGDVVADFLDFAFCGAPVRRPPLPVSNERVSIADLAVLLALQEAVAAHSNPAGEGAQGEPARALGWRVARMLATRASPAPRPALHRSLAEAAAEAFAADARAVDAEFLGGAAVLAPALAAAPDAALPAAQSLRLEDHFAPATVRLLRAWMAVVAELFALRPDDWPAHFQAHPLVVSDAAAGEAGGLAGGHTVWPPHP